MNLAGLKAEDAFIDWGAMSGWGLGYNVIKKEWSDEQLKILGIDKNLMPAIKKPYDIIGRLSKKCADLTGLPPLLVMVGESEILLDDAVRFSKKAEFYGVNSTLVVAEQMIHCWPLFAPILPEGQQALEYIGKYIQTQLS